MNINAPILIIEDDKDDWELFTSALQDIGIDNEVKCFENGNAAFDYLASTRETTFLIINDVNMPGINGLDLLKKLNENDDLRRRNIPFIFFSTSNSPDEVRKAYDLHPQGFFRKATNYHSLKEDLKLLIAYWQHAIHPNYVK